MLGKFNWRSNNISAAQQFPSYYDGSILDPLSAAAVNFLCFNNSLFLVSSNFPERLTFWHSANHFYIMLSAAQVYQELGLVSHKLS